MNRNGFEAVGAVQAGLLDRRDEDWDSDLTMTVLDERFSPEAFRGPDWAFEIMTGYWLPAESSG
jgi:hypothetical protein